MDIEENIDTELTGLQSKAGIRANPPGSAAAGAVGGVASSNGTTTSAVVSAVTNAGAAVLPPVAGAVYAAGTAAYQNRPNGVQGAVCAAVGAAAGVGTGAAITVAASGAGPVGTAAGIVVGNVAGNHVAGATTNACNAVANYINGRRKGFDGELDTDNCSYGELTQAIAQLEELPPETADKIGDASFRQKLTTGLQALHDKDLIDATKPLALIGAFDARFGDVGSQQTMSQALTFQAKTPSFS